MISWNFADILASESWSPCTALSVWFYV